jgi:hypothetical protein
MGELTEEQEVILFGWVENPSDETRRKAAGGPDPESVRRHQEIEVRKVEVKRKVESRHTDESKEKISHAMRSRMAPEDLGRLWTARVVAAAEKRGKPLSEEQKEIILQEKIEQARERQG